MKQYSNDPALNKAFKSLFDPGPEHNLMMNGVMIKHVGNFLADLLQYTLTPPFSFSMFKMFRIDNRRKTELIDGEYIFTYTLTKYDIANEPLIGDDGEEIYNGYANYRNWPGIAVVFSIKEYDDHVVYSLNSWLRNLTATTTHKLTGKDYHRYLVCKDHHAGIGDGSEGNGRNGGMSGKYKFPSQLAR